MDRHGSSALAPIFCKHENVCWKLIRGKFPRAGCCYKLPQTGCLKTTEIYSLTLLRLQVLKFRCWQGWLFLETLKADLFQASLLRPAGCWHPWCSSACKCVPSVSAYFPMVVLLCICVTLSKYLLARTLVTGLGQPNPVHLLLTWLHLQRPYFHITSHS